MIKQATKCQDIVDSLQGKLTVLEIMLNHFIGEVGGNETTQRGAYDLTNEFEQELNKLAELLN